MANDMEKAIEKNAQGPKSAKGDVGQVEQHALKDQIEAGLYLASREARHPGLCTSPSSLPQEWPEC